MPTTRLNEAEWQSLADQVFKECSFMDVAANDALLMIWLRGMLNRNYWMRCGK